jgi:AcrR family transcriptional regulator
MIQRLSSAALAVLARNGFGGLTIRLVAAEAGVGAATAYTYFSSKEHLVAEVFWRRPASSPMRGDRSREDQRAEPDGDGGQSAADRVIALLRHIALLVADEPEFAGAVTTALLGRDPDAEHLRDRIAKDIRGRLLDAVGAGADPALVDGLELLYTGALVHAGMGYVTYTEIADRLEESTRLLFSR